MSSFSHVMCRIPKVAWLGAQGRPPVLTSPGGFEGFFRELAEADRMGTLGSDAYAKPADMYGITCLD
jgi:hypothetical protein